MSQDKRTAESNKVDMRDGHAQSKEVASKQDQPQEKANTGSLVET